MINCRALLSLLVVVLLAVAFAGCSTLGSQPQIQAEVVMKPGSTLHLFHGGTQVAKALFCPGETVLVYRALPGERLRYFEVGKVRITRYLDIYFAEAVVLSGEMNMGDMAMKSNAACLVVPTVVNIK
jgi:hypothetical protein